MPEIDLEDVKIHYDEMGSGPFAYIHCHGLSRAGDAFWSISPSGRSTSGGPLPGTIVAAASPPAPGNTTCTSTPPTWRD